LPGALDWSSAEHFVIWVIPDTRAVVRTRPLEALIIGGYTRGLSDRDIESLAEEAELGRVSKTTVSRVLRELRDRYTAFCSKSLADVSVMALVHGRHLLVLSAAVYLAAVLVERAAA
jgi:transposase-like protein